MNVSLFDKLGQVIGFFFSSFLGLEILIIGLIILTFLILNLKRDNLLVKFITIFIIVIALVLLGSFNFEFTKTSVSEVMKSIIKFINYPSIPLYFVTCIIVTIIMGYTIFSKKINHKKELFNYIIFIMYYMCFFGSVSTIAQDKIKLTLDMSMYKNIRLLSFIQISNLIIFIWIVVTIIYFIYRKLHYKLDDGIFIEPIEVNSTQKKLNKAEFLASKELKKSKRKKN